MTATVRADTCASIEPRHDLLLSSWLSRALPQRDYLLEAELAAQIGGAPSFAQPLLIRRAARAMLQAEKRALGREPSDRSPLSRAGLGSLKWSADRQ